MINIIVRICLISFYASGVGVAVISLINGTKSEFTLAIGIGFLLCGLALKRKGGERVRKAAFGISCLLILAGTSFIGLSMWSWFSGWKFNGFACLLGAFLIIVSLFTIKYVKQPNQIQEKTN